MPCLLSPAHYIPFNRIIFIAEFAERAENHNRGNLNSNSCLYWVLISLLPYGVTAFVGMTVTASRWFRLRRTQEGVIWLLHGLFALMTVGVLWVMWSLDRADVAKSCKTVLYLIHWLLLTISWAYLRHIDRRDRRLQG